MISRLRKLRPGLIGAAFLFAAAMAAQAVAPIAVERVSVSPTEQEGSFASTGTLGLSADGRFAAFASLNSFSGIDGNGVTDIYVRDRISGFTELASRADSATLGGGPGNGQSFTPSISADGRYVAFESIANNLTADDGAAAINDIFVRDRRGATIRVSKQPTSANDTGGGGHPEISEDGEWVVFHAPATVTNLVPNDTNTQADVFLAQIGPTATAPFGVISLERVSTSTADAQANGGSERPSVSGDGRMVAFDSAATNLDPDDTDATRDVYVKNMSSGETILVSRASDDLELGEPGEKGDGDSTMPVLSADGRFVVFTSDATNLVEDDTNDATDVFIRDLENGITERVSVNTDLEEGDENSGITTVLDVGGYPYFGRSTISDDGRFVGFISDATNFSEDDNNLVADVFIRDRLDGTTERVSVSASNGESDAASMSPALRGDGREIAFQTDGTNLIEDDTNDVTDAYVATLGSGGGGNTSPTADAGVDFEAAELETVTLDGTGSFDLDDDELTFFWTQTSGTPVDLRNADSDTPFFIAPLAADTYEVTFQLSVSDGINPPVTDEVTVTVNPATAATVSGTVTTGDGTPVEGARVRIVRSDGQTATEAITDENGEYEVQDVRVGENTVTVDVAGFEPASVEVEVEEGDVQIVDVVLQFPTAVLQGRIQLANGSPLALADIELVDGDGNVIGQAQSDGKGNYRITNLDRNDLNAIVSMRVVHPSVITWTISNPGLVASTLNTRDFRFGTLQVNVNVRPANAKKKLNGTTVEIISGGKVVASNSASQRVRRLTFPNVPATALRIRASNPRLTGAQVDVVVPPGPTVHRVTVTLRARSRF